MQLELVMNLKKQLFDSLTYYVLSILPFIGPPSLSKLQRLAALQMSGTPTRMIDQIYSAPRRQARRDPETAAATSARKFLKKKQSQDICTVQAPFSPCALLVFILLAASLPDFF